MVYLLPTEIKHMHFMCPWNLLLGWCHQLLTSFHKLKDIPVSLLLLKELEMLLNYFPFKANVSKKFDDNPISRTQSAKSTMPSTYRQLRTASFLISFQFLTFVTSHLQTGHTFILISCWSQNNTQSENSYEIYNTSYDLFFGEGDYPSMLHLLCGVNEVKIV